MTNAHKTHSSPGKTPRAALAAPIVLAAGALLSAAAFLMAFLIVPPVNGASVDGSAVVGGSVVTNVQLLSQKIFYFHMPVAVVSFLALMAAAAFAVAYLKTRQQRFDTLAAIATEIALVFVICTMATGVAWTRFEWGVWWTWEPRLTTYLVLMLIVIAYFVLRASIDDPEKRAAASAVISVIALVDVPICFFITRLMPSSLHPVVLREGGMTAIMGGCVGLAAVGMLCVAVGLFFARWQSVRLAQRVEAIKCQLED